VIGPDLYISILSVNKKGDQFGLPFFLFGILFFYFKSDAQQQFQEFRCLCSSGLEDSWGKGIVSSIGWTSLCAGARCMPFSPAITAFWGRPFFLRVRNPP